MNLISNRTRLERQRVDWLSFAHVDHECNLLKESKWNGVCQNRIQPRWILSLMADWLAAENVYVACCVQWHVCLAEEKTHNYVWIYKSGGDSSFIHGKTRLRGTRRKSARRAWTAKRFIHYRATAATAYVNVCLHTHSVTCVGWRLWVDAGIFSTTKSVRK